MAKATKKKAVKKDPFNRRLKSAKFKNLDKDKAISDLREVIKTSHMFLNQTKYRFETMVDQNIYTYDDLQKALHQCELVFGAYEMGIEFEKDKLHDAIYDGEMTLKLFHKLIWNIEI